MTETLLEPRTNVRELIDEKDFKAVVDLVIRDNGGMQKAVAEAVLSEARHLLTEDDFNRLVERAVKNNPGVDAPLAEAIVEETLKFWAAAAHRAALRKQDPNLTHKKMLPSAILDAGWHALLLCTKVAAKLSVTLGHFTHHVPEVANYERLEEALAETQDAIRAAGYEPNPIMWDPASDRLVKIHGVSMHTECHDGGSACSAPPN
ncbi:hypothetical protein [Streptomyces sp. NPDC059761]|uniref:hypothetical protein n=1 Tax=Streptomyces sp. NPDC059761 TaxID=3346937 RepID=UPI003664FFB5